MAEEVTHRKLVLVDSLLAAIGAVRRIEIRAAIRTRPRVVNVLRRRSHDSLRRGNLFYRRKQLCHFIVDQIYPFERADHYFEIGDLAGVVPADHIDAVH